jgi:PBSX family phage portal protein
MAEAKKSEGGGAISVYVNPKEKSALAKLDGTPIDPATLQSNSLLYEDEFKGTYGGNAFPTDWRGAPDVQAIMPPLLPKTLQALVQNNTLLLCIDAMTTNVHETGYDLVLRNPPEAQPGQEPPEDDRVTTVKGFFDEVWPGMSFQQLRKKLSDDREQTGNAYWEILRDFRTRQMQMIRPLDAKITRMVIMSKATEQDVTVIRGGAKVTLKVMMRYRRFVQSLGTKYIFYKEYGCPLLINKHTGELLEDVPATRLKMLKDGCLGSEVMHFRAVEDVDTPYGVPKWWPQMPSVLGSRKAEEHNLEYFEAGGVPPLMIFVQGGTMGSGMKTALEEFLSSKPGAKQGAPVFEIQSTGGTLDNPGTGAKVTVERFGTERQKDSMFEEYDEKCEARVRRAWRLPPIFVGKSDDYTLATAQASYAVAEAQVFKPDRDEFDGLMNKTIMRELDPTGEVMLRSRGIPVKDVNQQLLAANAAFAAGGLDIDHYIETLNTIVDLNMKTRAGAKEDQQAAFKQKKEMGDALVEVAKRPPPKEVGSAPGSSKAPKATGKGSASGVSNSSPKPKLTTKGDELAELLVEAAVNEELDDVVEILGAVSDLATEQVLVFKTCLEDGVLKDRIEKRIADMEVERAAKTVEAV